MTAVCTAAVRAALWDLIKAQYGSILAVVSTAVAVALTSHSKCSDRALHANWNVQCNLSTCCVVSLHTVCCWLLCTERFAASIAHIYVPLHSNADYTTHTHCLIAHCAWWHTHRCECYCLTKTQASKRRVTLAVSACCLTHTLHLH
jgi:hypothetical protein